LSHASYYSYVETLAIPGFELRYANMVEIMAPFYVTCWQEAAGTGSTRNR